MLPHAEMQRDFKQQVNSEGSVGHRTLLPCQHNEVLQ